MGVKVRLRWIEVRTSQTDNGYTVVKREEKEYFPTNNIVGVEALADFVTKSATIP